VRHVRHYGTCVTPAPKTDGTLVKSMLYDKTAIAYAAARLESASPEALIRKMLAHTNAAAELDRQFRTERTAKLQFIRDQERLGEEAARRRLAIDFGARNGWTLSRTEFGIGTLGKGKVHGHMGFGGPYYSDNPYPGTYHNQFDHPYFYRRDRKAAAIVAHLYNYPGNHDSCVAIAERYGLAFSAPDDFPSWWFPGATRLVVYRGPAA
jgi:hypothetical protein